MKVTFSVVEEFLGELRHEQREVEDRIVRATFRYVQSPQVPFVYGMSVVAGFVVHGKLIELRQRCGDVTKPPSQSDEKTRVYSTQIMQQIEHVIDALHRDGREIALRCGVFEV